MSSANEFHSNGTGTNGAAETASDWRDEASEDLSGQFGRIRDKARQAYRRTFGQTSEKLSDSVAQARESVEDVLNLINRKPLVSMGVAAFVGLTLGLLLTTGRTRLVFVDRDD